MATLPGDAVFRPMTYPSELAGKSNGQLPTSILRTITYPGGGSGVFCLTAARAFTAMLDAMGKAGFKMMTVGGYRTYQQQVNLFLSRYKIVYYNSGILWNGNWWDKKDPQYATAAKPGESNHGWGLADDMAENLDLDPSAEGISQDAVNWLVKNADRYGISAELRSEAWHWRYYKGDNVPQAVLDFEKGGGEEEVAGYTFRVDGGDTSVWWVSDGMRRRQIPAGGYRGTLNGKGVVKDIGVLPRVTTDTIAENEEAYGGPIDNELGGGTSAGVTEEEAKAIATEVVAGSKIVP